MQGLEVFDARAAWYACHTVTQSGTPARETCYREAFGRNFGKDANTLQLMLALIQVCASSTGLVIISLICKMLALIQVCASSSCLVIVSLLCKQSPSSKCVLLLPGSCLHRSVALLSSR